MSACNCFSEPPCPAPVLECRSVSASRSKPAPCGFYFDGAYFSTRTVTYSYHPPTTMTGCGFPGGDSGPYSQGCDSVVTTTKSLVDGTCMTATVYSGSQSKSRTCAGETWTCSATQDAATGAWTNIITPAGGDATPGSGDCNVGCGSGTTVYSGAVTPESTSELISRAIAALPQYPESWTGSCSSYRNLSPDETSVTIRRLKWRIAHSPTASCYLKVWLRRKFTPEGEGPAVYAPIESYEWIGNPCIPDSTKPADHPENIIYGGESEEQEPSEDGSTSIEIQKYSCVRGYTPPDDGSANGFPEPL